MKYDLRWFASARANVLRRFWGIRLTAPAILRPVLTLLKYLGFFHVARHITRDGLRIICYHGFAVAEEYRYRSRLFIKKDLFRQRIEYLRRKRYPVLPLSEAVQALYAGRLPPYATVITMDDGWEGVYSKALPIIRELQLPVTVYVTTYYVEHSIPVYSVTLSYLFWRTKLRRVDLPRELGTFELNSQLEEADALAQEYGGALPPADRLKFLKEMAEALEVSFDEIETQQLFRVLDKRQLRELADAGVDVQLHSHTHQWPLDDRARVEWEIRKNRKFLERIVSHPLEHFCYPSGVYGLHQGEWLAALGVRSATTIEPGLNYADTPRFALRRLMDGHPVSDIEFEAELTGFLEIIRALRERRLLPMLRRRFRPHHGRNEIGSQQDRGSQEPGGADIASTVGQQEAGFYDRLHIESNNAVTRGLYYPLLRKVLTCVRDHRSRSILEVGCGNGFLAEMILQEHGGTYRGFDFSPVAVRNAACRTGRSELFFRADALDARSYTHDYDTIICTEVLEHIEADLDVIRLWRDGAWCICTVPNFDYESHVRFFQTSEEVAARYGEFIDIRAIIKVARSIIPDRRLRSYLRNLRWSRDDPSRFLGFLGVQTFDRLGGWFLFFGVKKQQER